jgi:putative DNA primase/helicase
LSAEYRQKELTALHRHVFGEPFAPPSVGGTRGSHECGAQSLRDDEFVERAMQATNGEKFKRLWAGDTSAYRDGDNDGYSEADLALCSLLAFWCEPNEERIDRLFRQSGLYRPKWDKRHYGDGRTYGQRAQSPTLSRGVLTSGIVLALAVGPRHAAFVKMRSSSVLHRG